MIKKTLLSYKPKYLSVRLKHISFQGTRQGPLVDLFILLLRRNGFLYRSIKLFNKLTENLRAEKKIERFKKGLTKTMESSSGQPRVKKQFN